jgi:hypothetical protein
MGGHFHNVVAELAKAFEHAKRPDGSSYTRMKEGGRAWVAGRWAKDLMLNVHQGLDGRLPDDWVYEHTKLITWDLMNHQREDADSARDDQHEICDGLVDVYNSARSEWLASHLGNAAIVDEACSDLDVAADADIFTRIGIGQYVALERIFAAVVDACETEAQRRDNAATDE